MGLFVDRPETLDGDVRVDLRRREVRVPEQLLDGAEIGAAVEEVRREAVPQRVRRGAAADAGLERACRRCGRASASSGGRRAVQEEGLARARPPRALGIGEVCPDRRDGVTPDRGHPLFPALPRRATPRRRSRSPWSMPTVSAARVRRST
jgi:hypothetical protein